MPSEIIEDKTFTKITAEAFSGYNNIYENCSFINSELSYADLSSITFVNCKFQGCNLTLIRLSDTGLQDIHFKDCKLSGADFSKSRDFLFEVNFEACILDNAVFLKNADLRTSYNYTIDPDTNMLKKARFSVHGLPGLLAKYDIRIDG